MYLFHITIKSMWKKMCLIVMKMHLNGPKNMFLMPNAIRVFCTFGKMPLIFTLATTARVSHECSSAVVLFWSRTTLPWPLAPPQASCLPRPPLASLCRPLVPPAAARAASDRTALSSAHQRQPPPPACRSARLSCLYRERCCPRRTVSTLYCCCPTRS